MRILAVLSLLLAVMSPGSAPWAQGVDQYGTDVEIAVLTAPTGTPLEEIVTGRARVGFTPVIRRGTSVRGLPGQSTWLRLRPKLPEDGQKRFLRIDRQAFDALRLYRASPQVHLLAEVDGQHRLEGEPRWPDGYIFALPEGVTSGSTLYLEAQGLGYLNLQPEWLTRDELSARESHSGFYYRVLYGGMLAVVLLALLRHWRGAPRVFAIALAGFFCLLASLLANGHFQFRLDGVHLGPGLPCAVLLMAQGLLLWTTRQYAGQDRTAPHLGDVLDWSGGGLALLGVAAVFTPSAYIGQLQLLTWIVLVSVATLCLLALSLDPRRWRWGPMLIWFGMIPAVLAVLLAMRQWLPASFMVRRGYELLQMLLLASFLLLPWLREWRRQRDARLRAAAPELSVQEKIAQAREQLMRSLQAGLENADKNDMEWIAYRRLLEGLKPVLPQVASAVVAMNYHNEDFMLAEPKSAEERYGQLLTQRGTLLKNLSKLRSPQQVSLDFDGPEGPLAPVQLAVIPLPIEKPGWGALLVERKAGVNYSEEELHLCAEFAALATTGAEEAGETMAARRAGEMDADTGVYRREKLEALLQKALAVANHNHSPMCVLRIGVDDMQSLPSASQAHGLRQLAQLLREEAGYGDSLARFASDEFMLLAPTRNAEDARTLAERMCGAVRSSPEMRAIGRGLTISIGIGAHKQGERMPQFILTRSLQALAKAREYGGNQVQAVAAAE